MSPRESLRSALRPSSLRLTLWVGERGQESVSRLLVDTAMAAEGREDGEERTFPGR